MFSDTSTCTVGQTTKTTKAGLPIGLFSQEEKIDEKEESEDDDDDDEDDNGMENTNDNAAEVDMSAVNGRLDRIEEMLKSLLTKSTGESKKVDK